MGALKHLLEAPPAPTPIPDPEVACIEQAHWEDGAWVWEAVEERAIDGEVDWGTLLRDIGQRRDPDTPYRARWTDRGGKVRRSAHFPVWQRPS